VLFARGKAAELAVYAAAFAAGFVPLTALLSGVLLQSRAVVALARATVALVAAALIFTLPHELLHAAVARAFGSRVTVRRFSLGFQTLFLDPLPLREAALTYLAPLLATPALLPLQLAGLPGVYVALWASMCAGDVAALLVLLAEKPEAVACAPEGRALALR